MHVAFVAAACMGAQPQRQPQRQPLQWKRGAAAAVDTLAYL